MGNLPARLTLALSAFMLVLLIALPLTVDSTDYEDAYIYIIYSLFLTCIGLIMGITMTWIYLSKQTRMASLEHFTHVPTSSAKLDLSSYNSAEQFIINFLLDNENNCWQSAFVKNSDMTDSKISRALTKLEARGVVTRVRDGMGKRVNLNQEGLH